MEAATTLKCFTEMIHTRGIYKRLGMANRNSVLQLRNNLKNGKVSTDKMEELLLKAGYSVKQEKLWNVPQ